MMFSRWARDQPTGRGKDMFLLLGGAYYGNAHWGFYTLRGELTCYKLVDATPSGTPIT